MQIMTGRYVEAFGKNTVYRFLNSTKTNWERLTCMLSARIINTSVRKLTSENRQDVFIIDDTLFKRTGGKKAKLCSKVFDHVSMKYMHGFRLLTLGWSDGNSFLPILGHLLGSSKTDNIPAKIVCVRNMNKKKDWIAFICTDSKLSKEEILRIYGKRWDIEVFFKTCKSMLNLNSECHSLPYDALTAHVSLVFILYMFLSLQQRNNCDDRTISELFLLMIDELADITFGQVLQLIFGILMQMIQERFCLSDNQLDQFMGDFIGRLPVSYQHALRLKAA